MAHQVCSVCGQGRAGHGKDTCDRNLGRAFREQGVVLTPAPPQAMRTPVPPLVSQPSVATPRSKTPLIIGAIVAVGGVLVIAAWALSGPSKPEPTAAPTATAPAKATVIKPRK